MVELLVMNGQTARLGRWLIGEITCHTKMRVRVQITGIQVRNRGECGGLPSSPSSGGLETGIPHSKMASWASDLGSVKDSVPVSGE